MNADSRNDSRSDCARAPRTAGTRGIRQQRVGILRNPNRTPLPPPRRASLTGKWPSLRSSRRAQAATLEMAESALMGEGAHAGAAVGADAAAPVMPQRQAPGAATDDAPHAQADARGARPQHPPGKRSGQVGPGPDTAAIMARDIDISRLMAEVAELGKKIARRDTSFSVARTESGHPPAAGAAATAPGHDGTKPDGAARSGEDDGSANPVSRLRRNLGSPFPPLAGAEGGPPAGEVHQSPASGAGASPSLRHWLVLGAVTSLAVMALLGRPGG